MDLPLESEKWIITKNEKGKIKVANCEEDETHIYEKTRDWIITEDACEPVDGKNDQEDAYKIARFFIRDLLNAKQTNDYFVCRNICFKEVFICGTVTDKNFKDDKYSLQAGNSSVEDENTKLKFISKYFTPNLVDDGTSSIKCMIFKTNFEALKFSDLKTHQELFNKQNESVILNAARIMVSSMDYLQRTVPSWEDLELGDVVKIIGKIKEFNSGRYLFFNKIKKEPEKSTAFISYLEHMKHLYTEVYASDTS